MKNFAHRGFSGKYPENTMLAFQKAFETGADGIELDVQLTKDGEVVIIHDETVDRTTDGTGYVRDYPLEVLQKLDASYLYKKEVGFWPIPTLREYCEWVCEKDLVTNIELKTSVFEYKGIEKKVLDLIREYQLEKKVIVSSFNHFSILRMKEMAPDLTYGLLTDTWLVGAGAYTSSLGVTCYHPNYRSLVPDVVEELKAHQIKINTYTVNREEDVKDLYEKGIDSVIGNFPDMVERFLKR